MAVVRAPTSAALVAPYQQHVGAAGTVGEGLQVGQREIDVGRRTTERRLGEADHRERGAVQVDRVTDVQVLALRIGLGQHRLVGVGRTGEEGARRDLRRRDEPDVGLGQDRRRRSSRTRS